jgi:hypothetical protein
VLAPSFLSPAKQYPAWRSSQAGVTCGNSVQLSRESARDCLHVVSKLLIPLSLCRGTPVLFVATAAQVSVYLGGSKDEFMLDEEKGATVGATALSPGRDFVVARYGFGPLLVH